MRNSWRYRRLVEGEVRLKKLSETRWSCRYDSIAAILATFLSILATLESIMNDTDRKRAIEAKGILAAVTELKFIASLVVYKKVFGLTSRLSEMLQNDSVDILSAITVTRATKQAFKTMRCDSSWDVLWLEVMALYDKIQQSTSSLITIRPRRQHRLPGHLLDSSITETLVLVYYIMMDRVNSLK